MGNGTMKIHLTDGIVSKLFYLTYCDFFSHRWQFFSYFDWQF